MKVILDLLDSNIKEEPDQITIVRYCNAWEPGEKTLKPWELAGEALYHPDMPKLGQPHPGKHFSHCLLVERTVRFQCGTLLSVELIYKGKRQ